MHGIETDSGELISIHAPRTGSDRPAPHYRTTCVEISIHAPRTGSDTPRNTRGFRLMISIHAPRTGSDI